MTDTIEGRIINNLEDVVGFFGAGNRLWFGDVHDIEFTEELEGDTEQDLLNAVQRVFSRLTNNFPENIHFELIPILDELDNFGGQEGDVLLFKHDVRHLHGD
jgi:hypothetical protein